MVGFFLLLKLHLEDLGSMGGAASGAVIQGAEPQPAAALPEPHDARVGGCALGSCQGAGAEDRAGVGTTRLRLGGVAVPRCARYTKREGAA